MQQISCSLLATHEQFEISCGKLNESLEEISLFAGVPCDIPELLEDLMTFPPVGVVVEIDPVQIVV